MLGPKVPNVEANIVGADTVLTADKYVPIGPWPGSAARSSCAFPRRA